MPEQKTSFLRRPDGRIRNAVLIPILLVILVVIAVIWQSGSGQP